MYADYGFYISEYVGRAIPVDTFNQMAAKASRYIDYITMGKAGKLPREELMPVKLCCCELAEQYYSIEQAAQSPAKKSESVGGYSVTYDTTDRNEAGAKLAEIARRHLGGTGLLYRGGGCGVCTTHCNSL